VLRVCVEFGVCSPQICGVVGGRSAQGWSALGVLSTARSVSVAYER